MKPEEAIAENFLKKNCHDVIYEPDGNVSPDFLIENSIAVEVRRLNEQYYDKDGNTNGLEETAIPLKNRIKKVFSNYNAETNNFWVALHYERVDGKLDVSEKMIREAIDAFQKQNEITPFKYKLSSNVSLKFVAGSSKLSHKYKIGIESDEDSGGWVVGLYTEVIKHCIKEKEKKINKKYKRWWLILVDYICCMDEDDKVDIVRNITKPSCFERIIVINHDGSLQFEI
ncbi:MAG: hypothetical protein JSS37_01725 [Proteobacteria bacterium]|nr:hypothetical protein [Pseudomonadota bacterium]